MDFKSMIKTVENIAHEEVKKMEIQISGRALEAIIKDMKKHENMIDEMLIEKLHKEYDINESIKHLIYEASTIAQSKGRTKICTPDIIEAMGKLCPTYWPFC